MEYKWQEEVEKELERLGLEPKWSSGSAPGWSIRCPNPNHNGKGYDQNRSAFCFADAGNIHCFGGCEATHINKLAGREIVPRTCGEALQCPSKPKHDSHLMLGDFTSLWLDLEPLNANIEVKGVPAIELNKRGWRWYPGGKYKEGIFIPYFNTRRDTVPFYQIRHLKGERRFTFPTGMRQICYGMEMLPRCKKYLCMTEGSRDSVILGMAGIPAIAFPSCSCKDMLNNMLKFCEQKNLTPVAICDRDEAGEKFLQAGEGVILDARSPVGKDVGDFFAEKGLEAVKKYYSKYIVTEENNG